MRSRSTSFSEKSDHSSRDNCPSPPTPLDPGAYFVHSGIAIMNQSLLQSSLFAQNYSLPSESDCIDHLGSHASNTYTNGGVPDQLRREGDLAQLSMNSGIRPLAHRPASHDPTFHSGSSISDSGSGSISTSPSSNASSLAFSPFPVTTVYPQGNPALSLASPFPTAQQIFPTGLSYHQPYNGMSNVRHKLSSITDTSPPGLLPPARPSFGFGVPVSPNSGTTVRENYTTSTPGLTRHLVSPRANADPLSRPSYNSIPETPRTMLSSTAMPLSPSSGYASGAAMPYQSTQDTRNLDTPPFSSQEDFHEIICNGHVVKPNIEAKIEKGFFLSTDGCWTCYRRNYFSVQCSYTLSPHVPNQHLFLNRGGKQEQIQAMAISLSAAVDGATGKTIELVQHTPKRDKGPQTAIQMTKLAPTPPGGKLPHLGHADHHSYAHNLGGTFGHTSGTGAAPLASPYLPLQNAPDGTSAQSESQSGYSQQPTSPTAHQHTFERIQFKSATANNGKRRAQQQYYHLIIELFVDVRQESSRSPLWVKVAQRASSQVVVRGRSPSHYSNEGPHSASSRGGGAGGGGMGPMGGSGVGGGLGSMSISRGMSTGFSFGGLGPYRGNQYAMGPSSGSSSSSSISAAPVDALPADHRHSMILSSNAEDEDPKSIEAYNGYQYYPSPLYEAGLSPPAKPEGNGYGVGRIKEEMGLFGPNSLLSGHGIGRFQGVDTSRGYYSVDTVY